MTRILILIATVFYSALIWSQNIDIKDAERDFSQYQSLYKTALFYRDTANMITGMLGMAGLKPQDTTYLKVLSKLYGAHQNYLSALLVCKRYNDKVPGDIEMLQLAATSSQNISNFDYALLLYTELFYRTQNPEFKYFAAYMEYELFRNEDCLKTINSCLQIPGVESKMVSVKSTNGESQSVPLKAVCLHLKGLEYIDMKDLVMAKTAFEEALRIFPNFTVAQGSLIETNANLQKSK